MKAMNEQFTPTDGSDAGCKSLRATIEQCDTASYRRWRDAKLARMPRYAEELIVEIGGLKDVGSSEFEALHDRVRRANMAIYACRDRTVDRTAIRTFAAGFGLRRIDHHLCADESGVTALKVATEGLRTAYIPYSNRGLSWHTDGYYNTETDRIHAIVLHCVRDAAEGGGNALLDPEIAYILLRDANPDFTLALTHPNCMTIPANHEFGREIRPARHGPVFSFDAATGALHMRYTARKKNVIWRDDATTRAAVAFLNDLLADEDGPILRHRLLPGQGIISNNVLHNRTAFVHDPARERLLYRARYFDRLYDTID